MAKSILRALAQIGKGRKGSRGVRGGSTAESRALALALALARRREQWPQQHRAARQPKWESQTAHMLWAMQPGLWYTRDDVVALLWPQDAERCRLNRAHVNSRLFKPGYVERMQDPAHEPGRLRAERRHLYRLTPKGIAYRDLLRLLS